ncbi:hypothetical protein [Halogranum amylolyticum]|nr:hypothetical protein [Halogranum amylolyticum]
MESAGPTAVRLMTDGGQESVEESADDESEESEATEEEEGENTEETEETGDDESSESEDSGESEETDDGESSESEDSGEGEEEGSTVLFLDLEGLFLNLLGLEVDLNEVVLDVSAVPGDSRLLGNLLSAVAGLLDGGSLGDLLGGGGLLGGLLGFGGDGSEDSESGIDRFADGLRDTFDEIVEELPLEELLTAFIKELFEQLMGGTESSESGDE